MDLQCSGENADTDEDTSEFMLPGFPRKALPVRILTRPFIVKPVLTGVYGDLFPSHTHSLLSCRTCIYMNMYMY